MRQGLKATAACVLAALLAQVTATTALAQTADDRPYTPSTRKLEEAASPMRWIRLAAELPRRSEAAERRDAKPATPSRPAAAPTRQKAAPRSVQVASSSPELLDPLEPPELPERPEPPKLPNKPVKPPAEPKLTPIAEVAPQWDAETLGELQRGRVKVRFAVQKDGSLEEIEVIESTDRRLTGPAMAAILQWQFAPMNEPANATVEFGFGDSATPPR